MTDIRLIAHVKYDDMSKIVCYVENSCLEIPNSSFKETKTIYLNGNTTSSSVLQTFFPYSLAKNKEKLTFYLNAELISYELYSKDPQYLIESPIYYQHIDYKWIFKEKEFVNFRSCVPTQWLYSPNFMNGCIGIYMTDLAPEKEEDYSDDITLGIEFYKIPNQIENFDAEIKFVTNVPQYNASSEGNNEFLGYSSIQYSVINGRTCTSQNISCLALRNFEGETLRIQVIIDIINVTIDDKDGNLCLLPKNDWYKYGIINNN